MAKIIEPGKSVAVAKSWPLGEVLSCAKCGCKWQLEKFSDFLSLPSATGPMGKRRLTSPCPNCGEQVDFAEEKSNV